MSINTNYSRQNFDPGPGLNQTLVRVPGFYRRSGLRVRTITDADRNATLQSRTISGLDLEGVEQIRRNQSHNFDFLDLASDPRRHDVPRRDGVGGLDYPPIELRRLTEVDDDSSSDTLKHDGTNVHWLFKMRIGTLARRACGLTSLTDRVFKTLVYGTEAKNIPVVNRLVDPEYVVGGMSTIAGGALSPQQREDLFVFWGERLKENPTEFARIGYMAKMANETEDASRNLKQALMSVNRKQIAEATEEMRLVKEKFKAGYYSLQSPIDPNNPGDHVDNEILSECIEDMIECMRRHPEMCPRGTEVLKTADKVRAFFEVEGAEEMSREELAEARKEKHKAENEEAFTGVKGFADPEADLSVKVRKRTKTELTPAEKQFVEESNAYFADIDVQSFGGIGGEVKKIEVRGDSEPSAVEASRPSLLQRLFGGGGSYAGSRTASASSDDSSDSEVVQVQVVQDDDSSDSDDVQVEVVRVDDSSDLEAEMNAILEEDFGDIMDERITDNNTEAPADDDRDSTDETPDTYEPQDKDVEVGHLYFM